MKILITGNGSFTNAIVERLLKTRIKEIRVFSRGEKSQYLSKNNFNDNRVKYIIGDIRDYEAINTALKGIDICIHSAAMKFIDKCEQNPFECVKTNVVGSMNVIQACINNKVKKLVCLSTDKATNSTTIYGTSKMLMEQMCESVDSGKTKIMCTRYGNVLGSNGSVVPHFRKLASEGKPLTITDPNMTRFFMSIEQAVDLVLYAIRVGKNKDLFVYNNKSASIKDLADCISDNQIVTGVRCVEKTDEALLTVNELNHSELKNDYFRVNKNIKSKIEYTIPLTSDTAERFSQEELKELMSRC